MICPICNAWTRTLETREKPGHQTYRRYECANGHTVKTLESVIVVPVTTTRADEVRKMMRKDYLGGMTASHLGLCLGMPTRLAREVFVKMRDAYVKSWIVEKDRWVGVWALAEDIEDIPRNCPKPTIAMVRGYCIGGGTGIMPPRTPPRSGGPPTVRVRASA
jgi:1,4-dihydroxy-2-naphthoyl-CoA synthase